MKGRVGAVLVLLASCRTMVGPFANPDHKVYVAVESQGEVERLEFAVEDQVVGSWALEEGRSAAVFQIYGHHVSGDLLRRIELRTANRVLWCTAFRPVSSAASFLDLTMHEGSVLRAHFRSNLERPPRGKATEDAVATGFEGP